MHIEIIGNPDGEREAFMQAMARLLRWGDPNLRARVMCSERNESGWLEWLIWIGNAEGQHRITIGMIQRSPDAEFEFHS